MSAYYIKFKWLTPYLLEVNIISKLHVLRVDAEDLKTASRVRDTNVDFTIEATETPQSGVDRVGPVGSSHDDNIRAGFETVHEGKELRNDTALDFTVGLKIGVN